MSAARSHSLGLFPPPTYTHTPSHPPSLRWERKVSEDLVSHPHKAELEIWDERHRGCMYQDEAGFGPYVSHLNVAVLWSTSNYGRQRDKSFNGRRFAFGEGLLHSPVFCRSSVESIKLPLGRGRRRRKNQSKCH